MKNLKLLNLTKNTQLANEVLVADGLWSRMKGLLGMPTLPKGQTLWIHQCNSVHTWFMKFSIDCVFVSKDLQVKAIYRNLKPWKVTFPKLTADSVFEFSAGQIDEKNISIGDQLNVGH